MKELQKKKNGSEKRVVQGQDAARIVQHRNSKLFKFDRPS